MFQQAFFAKDGADDPVIIIGGTKDNPKTGSMDGIAIRVDETRIFKWAFQYSTYSVVPSNAREDEILKVD